MPLPSELQGAEAQHQPAGSHHAAAAGEADTESDQEPQQSRSASAPARVKARRAGAISPRQGHAAAAREAWAELKKFQGSLQHRRPRTAAGHSLDAPAGGSPSSSSFSGAAASSSSAPGSPGSPWTCEVCYNSYAEGGPTNRIGVECCGAAVCRPCLHRCVVGSEAMRPNRCGACGEALGAADRLSAGLTQREWYRSEQVRRMEEAGGGLSQWIPCPCLTCHLPKEGCVGIMRRSREARTQVRTSCDSCRCTCCGRCALPWSDDHRCNDLAPPEPPAPRTEGEEPQAPVDGEELPALPPPPLPVAMPPLPHHPPPPPAPGAHVAIEDLAERMTASLEMVGRAQERSQRAMQDAMAAGEAGRVLQLQQEALQALQEAMEAQREGLRLQRMIEHEQRRRAQVMPLQAPMHEGWLAGFDFPVRARPPLANRDPERMHELFRRRAQLNHEAGEELTDRHLAALGALETEMAVAMDRLEESQPRECRRCGLWYQRVHGCPHIRCVRCQAEWCDGCGGEWRGGCTCFGGVQALLE